MIGPRVDVRFSIVSVGQKHRTDRRASLLVHTLLRQAPCPCTAHARFDPIRPGEARPRERRRRSGPRGAGRLRDPDRVVLVVWWSERGEGGTRNNWLTLTDLYRLTFERAV